MLLINVTRGSMIDVTGVPDTPLRPVTIKIFKIMSTATKNYQNHFSGALFLESIFPDAMPLPDTKPLVFIN